MKAHVLLVDDNASRSAERWQYLVGAGIEVINASDDRQAIEVVQSHRVDVVCIDAQSAVNRGSGIGAFVKYLKPHVPVVLIADDGRIPGHFEEHVDIVIDRADFDIRGDTWFENYTGIRIHFSGDGLTSGRAVAPLSRGAIKRFTRAELTNVTQLLHRKGAKTNGNHSDRITGTGIGGCAT